MKEETFAVIPLWPLGLFFLCALAVAAFMILFSRVLGERHRGRVTNEPYESGMPVTGQAGVRFGVPYYRVAVAFVIFDVEAMFVFAWAAAVRDLGWPGYFAVLVFIAVLLIALVYVWRLGVLDLGRSRSRQEKTADL